MVVWHQHLTGPRRYNPRSSQGDLGFVLPALSKPHGVRLCTGAGFIPFQSFNRRVYSGALPDDRMPPMTRLFAFLLAATPLVACDEKEITDADSDGSTTADGDCNDKDANIYPGAAEICDGIDNDCNGQTDENTATDISVWYPDADSDGFGDDTIVLTACTAPAFYVAAGGDCYDQDASIHPDADEICDGIDNNCDGETDGDDVVGASEWFLDNDGDGYGGTVSGISACNDPGGVWISDGSDCDDTSASAFPGAAPNDSKTDCMVDRDGDGYGDALASGATIPGTDCDDTDNRQLPGADEYCNEEDDDCDGTIDEDAVDVPTWYFDSDGDGRGDNNDDKSIYDCTQPSGYVDNNDDCDDTDPSDESCICYLDSVGTATTLVSSGSIYGSWMADPEETLGTGLYWEMDSYYGYTLTEYPSVADLTARTNSTAITLTSQYEGTGGVTYDGYLYYPEYNTNTIIKYDIDLQTEVGSMTLTDAGYHNTYYYGWGGYSDIDMAVDENGLWAIYATSGNSGKIVVSSIDPDKMAIIDTWNTTSGSKTSTGNAFMICGVLYVTSSYSSTAATINYAYDTNDSSSWSPGISLPSTYGYTSHLSYNPTDGLIHAWDYSRRVTFTTTTSN
ncbi:MAG: hypothetical protein ACI8RZ_000886 [Myxococcota bacterium]|jgi:hypothetical protein